MVKMYGLYCPYGIHYICGMTLTCNGALHCICTGTSHFMSVSAWLKSNTSLLVVAKWAWYCWTKSNKVTRLYDMEKKLVSGNSKKD